MKIFLKKQSGETANFSAILPGSCNAKCNFCFWKRSAAESSMYAQQMAWYLSALGDKVTQISLTGGEPTLSPVFDSVIDALRPMQCKIVLTTNGAAVKDKLLAMAGVVRHLNISRHDIDDAKNREIFKTQSVPSKDELIEICELANSLNIDVTLNRVIPADFSDIKELTEFVGFAKTVGASSISFRKDYSVNSLDCVPVEGMLGRKGVTRSCPVCATNSYIFKGMPIHFKMSIEEPSDVLPYIYEFVYHPNGALTEDWEGVKQIEFVAAVENQKPREVVRYVETSGCGQSSRLSGC